MQYVLTKKGRIQLIEAGEKRTILSISAIQDLCTKVADHMPVDWGVGYKGADPKPWGCIHTKQDWYCDECPVQKVCPSDLHYSK